MSYKKYPEMVHLVEYLPHKHENLSVVTRTHLKKYNPSTGEAQLWDTCITGLYTKSSTNPGCAQFLPSS